VLRKLEKSTHHLEEIAGREMVLGMSGRMDVVAFLLSMDEDLQGRCEGGVGALFRLGAVEP